MTKEEYELECANIVLSGYLNSMGTREKIRDEKDEKKAFDNRYEIAKSCFEMACVMRRIAEIRGLFGSEEKNARTNK